MKRILLLISIFFLTTANAQSNKANMENTINFYVKGMRLFGGVEAPKSSIKVKIYLSGKLIIEDEIKPPAPSNGKRGKIFTPDYISFPLNKSQEVLVKSDNYQSKVIVEASKSAWVHINYEHYPEDHPNKKEQGLDIHVTDRPQKFR